MSDDGILSAFRARQPGAPLARILWWHFLHFLCFIWVGWAYRYRAWGTGNIPATGPLLLAANHQSVLDPILVGLASHHRQFYAMARASLFGRRVLGWLIRSLNAIPIERGESDLAAMRKCLDVLQRGHALLIFPEGTRTLDGTTGPFAPGTMLLIKRARPMVVPVAIEGAFEAWPRDRKLPCASGRIEVMYGRPIPAAELLAMPAAAALERLRGEVESMRLALSERLRARQSTPEADLEPI